MFAPLSKVICSFEEKKTFQSNNSFCYIIPVLLLICPVFGRRLTGLGCFCFCVWPKAHQYFTIV